MTSQFKDYSDIEKFIETTVPKTAVTKFPGELGLARIKRFLELLGKPQEKVKVIHIAGTSGKGSTASFLSKILTDQGFKTGLTLSPTIYDLRERVQINSQFIEVGKFCQYFQEIFPYYESFALSESGSNSDYGLPTFFELMMVLAYYSFAQEQVDYAVVETGMGGLLDGSNVVIRQDKLCVITRIGKDHTKILGNTYQAIASQKAGIINHGQAALSLKQNAIVNKVLQTRTHAQNSKLELSIKGRDYDYQQGLFNYTHAGLTLRDVKLGLTGAYQAENAALAVTAVLHLAKRDGLHLQVARLRDSLQQTTLAGRFSELDILGQKVIIDGAHNPQKMSAFLQALQEKYPHNKYHFLLAIKRSKDFQKMLREIALLAQTITLTSFHDHKQDFVSESTEVKYLRNVLARLGFKDAIVELNSQKALQQMLTRTKQAELIVATGSLFLAGKLLRENS